MNWKILRGWLSKAFVEERRFLVIAYYGETGTFKAHSELEMQDSEWEPIIIAWSAIPTKGEYLGKQRIFEAMLKQFRTDIITWLESVGDYNPEDWVEEWGVK